MFQFRRFPTYTYLIQCTLHGYCPCGLPHSEICGLQDICSSPQLIAACHVLLRLLMPRHSPCALFSLTFRRGKLRALRFRLKAKTSFASLPLLSNCSHCVGLQFVLPLIAARRFARTALFGCLVLLNYAGFLENSFGLIVIITLCVSLRSFHNYILHSSVSAASSLLPCYS